MAWKENDITWWNKEHDENDRLIAAPIDGKNVIDDFDWLTDGDRVEINPYRNEHHIAFYNNDILCELTYYTGDNECEIWLHNDTEEKRIKAFIDIRERALDTDSSQGLLVRVTSSFRTRQVHIAYFWDMENE